MELGEIAVGLAAWMVHELWLPSGSFSASRCSLGPILIGRLPLSWIQIRFAVMGCGRYPRVQRTGSRKSARQDCTGCEA